MIVLDPKKTGRTLFRCDCGRLFWSDSPPAVQREHVGHRYRAAGSGTWWELLKARLGMIR